MGKRDYKRLLGEITNLQSVIQERRNKREPFLSSFADALESVVKKAKEWFELESKLASREVAILEELLPEQGFVQEKNKLKAYNEEFEETATKFDDTITSIREKKIKSLKDFIEGGVFTLVTPEFLNDFKKMYDVCVKLEELIESLEQGAKYISVALRMAEIYIEGRD